MTIARSSRPASRHSRALGMISAFTCLLLWGTPCAPAQQAISLFNGTSLLGWSSHGSWNAQGGILSTAGTGPRSVTTAMPFGDLRLEFDFNESNPMGARLRLWSTHEGTGGLLLDMDTSGSSAGTGGIESLSHSSVTGLPPGWHHVTVEAAHGTLSTRVDNQPSGNVSSLGARAGFVQFEAAGTGTLQIRNVRVSPQGLNNLFNGTDLTGWKSVARAPDAKGGVGHAVEKTFTFGLGGGSTKPHEANWSVRSGAIHGEDGPGGLENTTGVEDGVYRVTASVKGSLKADNPAALSLRGTAGQIGSGYAVGIGPFAGSIEHLVKRAPTGGNGMIDETIVIAGRTIAVWSGGNLLAVHTDTRPEAASAATGARSSSGALSLLLPPGEELNVRMLTGAPLGKSYGLPPRAPAPPPPVVAPVAAAAAASAPAASSSPAEQALLSQQRAQQQQQQTDQANKQRVASLTREALATDDPQQQMSLYGQVIQLDPANSAAIQGYKEAQGKIQAQQAAQQQAATSQAQQQQQAQTREQTTNDQLLKAQTAFLNGHLTEASSALSVAERLSPGNPLVRELRARISSAQSVRSRMYLLGGGAGLVSLLAAIALWTRRRRQQRFPVLEITRGLDKGQLFPLEKDLVRIGAVAGSGAQKNDIVLHDVEHALSRFHCEIARKNGQLYITDLSSSNGTRLDGNTLKAGQPELLRKGSTLTLANNIDLRFGYDRRARDKA